MSKIPLHASLVADFIAIEFADIPQVATENTLLLKKVLRITSWLRLQGVKKNSLIVSLFPPDKNWIALDMAILRCGAIHVPFHMADEISLATEYFEQYLFIVHRDIKYQTDTKANQIIVTDLSDDFFQDSDIHNSTDNKAVEVDPHHPAEIIFSYHRDCGPKPFVISHDNLLKTAVAAGKELPLTPGDKYLSLLPFSKIYGRVSLLTHQLLGCIIECPQQILLPSRLIKVSKAASVAVVPSMLQYPVKVDGACSQLLKGRSLATLDELPPEAIRPVLGDTLKIIICGGAMIPSDLLQKFEAASLPLMEGYGLTQTTGVFTLNTVSAHRTGSKGKALNHMSIKISDDGEILAKGAGISSGIILPDGTIEKIDDSNNWFHTSDEGYIDADGFLFLTGNKKNVFKLANGYYYNPQPDEKRIADEINMQTMICRDEKGNLHLLAEKITLSSEELEFLKKFRTNPFSMPLTSLFQTKTLPCCRPYVVVANENWISLK